MKRYYKDLKLINKDKHGNMLLVYPRKTKTTFYLLLKGENYPRNIGYIKNNILFVKRDKLFHIHMQTKSFGFNYELLKFINDKGLADKVVIVSGNLCYKQNIDFILDKGFFKFYKEQGFELQIFIPTSELELDIIKHII